MFCPATRCPVGCLQNYLLARGKMQRKAFTWLLVAVVMASLVAMITFIATLSPAAYKAVEDFQTHHRTGSLPDGYGWADGVRLVLLTLFIPAVIKRLRDAGWSVWWVLLGLPSLLNDIIDRVAGHGLRPDASFGLDVLAAGLLLVLVFKRSAE